MTRKPTQTVKLQLRLPESLRRRLVRDAGWNRRSMNAEIVERLERSFEREEQQAGIESAIDAVAVDTSEGMRQLHEEIQRVARRLEQFQEALSKEISAEPKKNEPKDEPK